MAENDPRLAALRFVPAQLSRARELAGLTKTALAKRVAKTPSALTQFESGLIRPDAETVARLALALGVPVGFFAHRALAPPIRLDDCHFRSLRSVSQNLRRQALRTGETVQEIFLLLERYGVEFPEDRLSPLKRPVESAQDIEDLARAVRRAWGLGAEPLADPGYLLESQGARLLPLGQVCQEVDAFSLWYARNPFIFINQHKPASRIHFDLAHELGHLLMHEDVAPADPEAENQADQFAAALLLPADSFLAECPGQWRLPVFEALKQRWRVSIRALVYRAHKLGCLSSASYRRAFVDLNRLYGPRQEPGEWALPGPRLLREALALVRAELPPERLAERLALHKAGLQALLQVVLPEETAAA